MIKALKSPWTYLILVIILIGIFFIGKNLTGNVVGEGEHDQFAQYLTAQGVTMYGTEWCSHCQNQKKLFGSSFQYIDFVDCDKNKQACVNAGVTGYPTWKINGQNYPGEQSFARLSQLSGYN